MTVPMAAWMMIPAMLAVMLWRYEHYATAHGSV